LPEDGREGAATEETGTFHSTKQLGEQTGEYNTTKMTLHDKHVAGSQHMFAEESGTMLSGNLVSFLSNPSTCDTKRGNLVSML